jgi:hypothetical protein
LLSVFPAVLSSLVLPFLFSQYFLVFLSTHLLMSVDDVKYFSSRT